MTRPAGRVRRCLKSPWVESGRLGSASVGNLTGRVESGGVKRFPNITGWVRVTLTRSDSREGS